MDRAPGNAAALLAGALVLLLPSLVSADAPAVLVGLAVVAAALTAMVRSGASFGALAARTPVLAYADRRSAPPLLPGRATDPVHHPLRPRAPGTV